MFINNFFEPFAATFVFFLWCLSITNTCGLGFRVWADNVSDCTCLRSVGRYFCHTHDILCIFHRIILLIEIIIIGEMIHLNRYIIWIKIKKFRIDGQFIWYVFRNIFLLFEFLEDIKIKKEIIEINKKNNWIYLIFQLNGFFLKVPSQITSSRII